MGSVRSDFTTTVPAPQPRTVRLRRGAGRGTTRASGTLRFRISTSSPSATEARYSLRWFLNSAILATFMAGS